MPRIFGLSPAAQTLLSDLWCICWRSEIDSVLLKIPTASEKYKKLSLGTSCHSRMVEKVKQNPLWNPSASYRRTPEAFINTAELKSQNHLPGFFQGLLWSAGTEECSVSMSNSTLGSGLLSLFFLAFLSSFVMTILSTLLSYCLYLQEFSIIFFNCLQFIAICCVNIDFYFFLEYIYAIH